MFEDPRVEAKAAQSAAYLLNKAGGSLELLKLMKLMYLAERKAYAQLGRPMIGDEPFADRHGPVLNSVYKAAASENDAGPMWRKLIMPRDGNDIVLADADIPLKKLSQADRLILDSVWGEFGQKSGSQLRKWTHKYCPEYDELSFSEYDPRRPIELHRLLTAVGYSSIEAAEIAEQNAVNYRVDQQILQAA